MWQAASRDHAADPSRDLREPVGDTEHDRVRRPASGPRHPRTASARLSPCTHGARYARSAARSAYQVPSRAAKTWPSRPGRPVRQARSRRASSCRSTAAQRARASTDRVTRTRADTGRHDRARALRPVDVSAPPSDSALAVTNSGRRITATATAATSVTRTTTMTASVRSRRGRARGATEDRRDGQQRGWTSVHSARAGTPWRSSSTGSSTGRKQGRSRQRQDSFTARTLDHAQTGQRTP